MQASAVVGRIAKVVNGIGVSSLFMIMLLISADVFGRYFFDKPILGVFEVTEVVMVLIVFLGVAYTGMMGEHVSLGELLLDRFPVGVKPFMAIITNILSICLLSLIAWQSIVQANVLQLKGDISESLHIPIYPFLWVIAFGSVLLCIVLLLDVRTSLAQMTTKSYWWDRLVLILGLLLVLMLFATPLWALELPYKISPYITGLLVILALIVLLLVGMPVGFAMGVAALMGLIYLIGPKTAITILRTVPYSTVASWTMTAIPLFVLMGTFAFYGRLGHDLYHTAYRWLARLPGGLAMASVAACAGFAAVSGSGIATAATMGTVSLPEMKKYEYDDALATGSIAAGGTMGVLIPPSITLILYGILTEQSIGALFAAGFLPGILEAVFYMVTIYIISKWNIFRGPPGPSTTLKEKLYSLKDSWQVLLLFTLVMGGLYGGVFTPTEAAAVGAFLAYIFALARRRLTPKNFWDSLIDSGKITSMVFVILVGAMILSPLLAVTRLPQDMASYAATLPVSRYIILTLILLIYLLFGCFLSTLAMILLTIPIFFPVIVALGFDPLWFGVLVVRMSELGTITPPFGINVFVIKGVVKDVPTWTIYKGILPFFVADVLHVTLLVLVPQISLFLPSLMYSF